MKFRSHGKLLLTGEYAVLDGAKALAVPTKKGQGLTVSPKEENLLEWNSFDHKGKLWFHAVIDIPKLETIEGSNKETALTLVKILKTARELNLAFLDSDADGFLVETHLEFPRLWGLGTSSTLINNLAQWAHVDPYQLLWKSFGGSGYDIACASAKGPIYYQLKQDLPQIEKASFDPSFVDRLFLVYLNQKKSSAQAIKQYRRISAQKKELVSLLSRLSQLANEATSLHDFGQILEEHENVLSKFLNIPTIKSQLFSDYPDTLKSLGAWGGDFVLALAQKENNPSDYFNQRGYQTVIPFSDLVLLTK